MLFNRRQQHHRDLSRDLSIKGKNELIKNMSISDYMVSLT